MRTEVPGRAPRLLPLLIAVLWAGCSEITPPIEPEGDHVFTYAPPAQAPAITSVSVRGGFNGWGELPMKQQADGSWRATTDLADGTYEYKYFINGSWPSDMCGDDTWGHPAHDRWIDPEADGCVPDGHGGQNAVRAVGTGAAMILTHAPGNPAHLSVAGGRTSVRFRVNFGHVQAATVTAASDSFPMHLQLSFGLQEIWRASLPAGITSYGITVQTSAGTQEFGPYTAAGDLFTAVEWVGQGVGYQIFPERFWNGDPGNDHLTLETDEWHVLHESQRPAEPNYVFSEGWSGPITNTHCCHQYFGGDLQGIIDRLDHLESLGVTLIYLNPIFLAGSAHGYDTWNYLQVAPNFGDEQLLRTLMEAAAARGMRMMWDFVPNHVGVGHWAFRHAIEHGHDSPHWNWFNFKVAPGQVRAGHGRHYDGWWGLGSLPVLQTQNPEVFAHLMEVTRYWTEFGFDGIRVDVPNEIRNRSAFFSAFRQTAKAINPEVYLIGEVWQRDASWLRGDQFDALMNYAIGEEVIERFANGQVNASGAARDMAQLYAEYAEAATAMQFNLISSHDTGRLLTKMGGGAHGGTPAAAALARHRLAAAMLYALPGVPVTFQGDECAFLGTGEGPREENRYPMQWHACDASMLAHYQQLAALRQTLGALRTPALRQHRATGSLLSFFRGEPGAGEVLVVFNSSAGAQTLALPPGSWTDALSGETTSGTVQVDGLGWRYLRRS